VIITGANVIKFIFGSTLLMFLISECLALASQSSIMAAGKARVYPSEALFRSSTLE
jgi:hypothetical protein